jgi:DNA-binding CsgD family transcriptional regulator
MFEMVDSRKLDAKHLLERDQEVKWIKDGLDRARTGHGGAFVIEGPAGIGKTALLNAGRIAASDEFRVLRARGAELEREFAFGVVRQLFEPVLAAPTDEERARLFEGPPGVAAQLLGVGASGDGNGLFAPDPSFAILHGLYWLCANLASERPLALVVDDLHWADSASMRFLAFLLPRLEELRVAVLLAARPAEAGDSRGLLAALTVDPASEVITVGPLSIAGVSTLLAVGMNTEPESNFANACWEATGGTPFLVHTLIEALRDEHIEPIDASVEEVKNLGSASLGRWAMLRLTRLGRHATDLARAVAVMERAELDQAARLARLSFSDAARAADLLVRARMFDEAPLGFAHPLMRGAVYRDIAMNERAEGHLRAARFLAEAHANPAKVAQHLLVTVPSGDEWTVEQLRSAALGAAARGAPESVAAYLRRALSEPPSPAVKWALLLELGHAEYCAGQSGWHEHLKGAVDAAISDVERVTAALLFANALRWHERTFEAVEVCDRAAAALDEGNLEGRLVLEAMAVVSGVLDATTSPFVSDRAGALLKLAKESSVPRQCLASAAYVAALINEPASDVAELVARACAVEDGARRISSDPPWFPGGAFRHPSAVVTLLWAERFDDARALADAAVAEAQSTANGMVLPAVLAQRAWVALQRGDLSAAEVDARALLDNPGTSVPSLLSNRAMSVLVNVLVERGDLDGAEKALDRVSADLESAAVMAHVLRHARGRLRYAQGRFAEALDDFRVVAEITIVGLPPSPTYLPWRSDAALAASALGDHELARQLSEEEVELARAFGAPRCLGVALRAAGLVAERQYSESLLREAIMVLDDANTRLEQARAQVDLGSLLRLANQLVEARQLLRSAVDTAHRHGAAALASRAESELRATGAKPRHVRLTGLESLTASERRIAELAASGLTNRQIAQTLFVTDRTVEGHLTRVFAKLDVKKRTELAEALNFPTS